MAHICKDCAQLPLEEQTKRMTLNRLCNLLWQLSSAQKSWLWNWMKDKRPRVRELAHEQYKAHFAEKRRKRITATSAMTNRGKTVQP